MPIAVTTEQLALADVGPQWAKRADPIALVRQLEPGRGRPRRGRPGGGGPSRAPTRYVGDAPLLGRAGRAGFFSIALPAALGGAAVRRRRRRRAGAGPAALLPGPVLPTLLAGLVLARPARPSHAHPP